MLSSLYPIATSVENYIRLHMFTKQISPIMLGSNFRSISYELIKILFSLSINGCIILLSTQKNRCEYSQNLVILVELQSCALKQLIFHTA